MIMSQILHVTYYYICVYEHTHAHTRTQGLSSSLLDLITNVCDLRSLVCCFTWHGLLNLGDEIYSRRK